MMQEIDEDKLTCHWLSVSELMTLSANQKTLNFSFFNFFFGLILDRLRADYVAN